VPCGLFRFAWFFVWHRYMSQNDLRSELFQPVNYGERMLEFRANTKPQHSSLNYAEERKEPQEGTRGTTEASLSCASRASWESFPFRNFCESCQELSGFNPL